MEEIEETEQKVFGLENNVAGALAYIGGFVTGLIFFFANEENKFVRFHALQSILLSLPLFILSIIWRSFFFMDVLVHILDWRLLYLQPILVTHMDSDNHLDE